MTKSLDELALEYEHYPYLFTDWPDNRTAQDIRWDMLQEMLKRFPEDAVFKAIGRAIDTVRLLVP